MAPTAVLTETPTTTLAPAPNPRELGPALTERPHRAAFLAMLTEALASYGMATHELEEAVERCAARLHVPARVSATPTSIFLMIGTDDDERTRLILPKDAGVNLTRLAELSRTARRVEAGEITAREGIEELRVGLRARPAPSLVVDALGGAAVPVAVLTILGAPLADLAAGAVVGLVVALVLAITSSVGRLSRVAMFATATSAAATAVITDTLVGPIDVFPVTLAGLLPLLPGLSLTIAIGEIAAGSLVSGASRLIGALTVMLYLGFGVAVGFRASGATELSLAMSATAIPPAWALWAALGVASWALTVSFRARWFDFPIILSACALALFTAQIAGSQFGPEFSALVGAFTLGVAANLYERLTKAPAQIALLPGMLLLVPGSVGFTSVHSFMGADAIAGIEGVFSMFVIAVGIVTGLLLASVLTTPSIIPVSEPVLGDQ